MSGAGARPNGSDTSERTRPRTPTALIVAASLLLAACAPQKGTVTAIDYVHPHSCNDGNIRTGEIND